LREGEFDRGTTGSSKRLVSYASRSISIQLASRLNIYSVISGKNIFRRLGFLFNRQSPTRKDCKASSGQKPGSAAPDFPQEQQLLHPNPDPYRSRPYRGPYLPVL